jgi:hypothetical protein
MVEVFRDRSHSAGILDVGFDEAAKFWWLSGPGPQAGSPFGADWQVGRNK